MRILLVNNNTKHLAALRESLAGHDVEVLDYHPGVHFDRSNKDLIILSGGGGEGREANDRHKNGHLWYQDELELIKHSRVPILGICMGFELICLAYGSSVEKMKSGVRGYKRIHSQSDELPSRINQFAYHEWHVADVDEDELEVMADSYSGVEIVRHRDRPILGVQFHPEIDGGSLTLPELINKTVSLAQAVTA